MSELNPLEALTGPARFNSAFQLASEIAESPDGERYTRLYDEMIDHLRAEAAGLPMNTLQEILIERIASTYVTIRYREDNESWKGTRQQKEFNDYWLDLTKEFNKLLKSGTDEILEKRMIEVENALFEALPMITNKEERQAMRMFLGEKFMEMGM